MSIQSISNPFEAIFSGQMSEEEIAGFLLGLNEKGITQDDIIMAATVMRDHMIPFETPDDCMDVCGTGGDGHGTYNISTAVAFVVASCGVKVAKHGNRAISSKAGSSDVLSELGVAFTAEHDKLQHCLDTANICFLAAPLFHPAMKHIAPVRAKLGVRTIFNLLGPLCNPARVTSQMMGVYDASLVDVIAHVLKALGCQNAIVVHSADGLDEFSISDGSAYATLSYGLISRAIITPEQLGVTRRPLSELFGGDAKQNAAALRRLFDGEKNAYREAVLINAGAALTVANQADDIESGAILAAEAIDSGRAKRTLDLLVKVSQNG